MRNKFAKKTKQDKTKPIKPNNPQISKQNLGYILLIRISNVTFNPQLVLFDRLPTHIYIYNIYIYICSIYVVFSYTRLR